MMIVAFDVGLAERSRMKCFDATKHKFDRIKTAYPLTMLAGQIGSRRWSLALRV
jgi:hypothetical protein